MQSVLWHETSLFKQEILSGITSALTLHHIIIIAIEIIYILLHMNWSFFHVYFDFKELIKVSHRISPLGFYCVCFEI